MPRDIYFDLIQPAAAGGGGPADATEPDWAGAGVGTPDAKLTAFEISPVPGEGSDLIYQTFGSGNLTFTPSNLDDKILFNRYGQLNIPYLHLENYNTTLDFDLDYTNNIGALTISMVMRIPSLPEQDGYLFLIQDGVGGANSARLGLEIDYQGINGGALRLESKRLDGDSMQTSTASGFDPVNNDRLIPGRWYSIIIVADWAGGNGTKLYVNGTLAASNAHSTGNTSATDSLESRIGVAGSTLGIYNMHMHIVGAWFWKSVESVASIEAENQKLITNDGEEIFTSSGTTTVPEGATQVVVRMWGAGGGGGFYEPGGAGAYICASIDVTPGETLDIDVGTGGGSGSSGGTYVGGTPGGGDGDGTPTYKGGGGGGYSAIRQDTTYYLVAGAGGGAGIGGSGTTEGGGAGITAGADGGGTPSVGTAGGKGATDTAGGAGGTAPSGADGNAGTSLQGGDAPATVSGDGAGGGGGGYYGGGSGASDGFTDGGGGGGGSSYTGGASTVFSSVAATGDVAGGTPPSGYGGGGDTGPGTVGDPGLVILHWSYGTV